MLEFITHLLYQLQYPHPDRPQDVPHKWTAPTYGAKVQYAPTDEDLPILPSDEIT